MGKTKLSLRQMKETLLKRVAVSTETYPAQAIASNDLSQPQLIEASIPTPSSTALTTTFAIGLKVLHACDDANVDICFIHGLNGDRDTTWMARGESEPWPKTLLPLQMHRARILSYGYGARVVASTSPVSINRLSDHAENLLGDLERDRASCDASSRPLIFVVHSLGGLVCKRALLISRNNPESHLRSIFQCAKGILFLGTPHKGSWIANGAKLLAAALGTVITTNKDLLEVLKSTNEFLGSIQRDFDGMIRDQQQQGRPLQITCFFEELPLPVVGIVVAQDSATLDGCLVSSIPADHRNMARFASVEEVGFQRVVGELLRWQSQLVTEQQSNQVKPNADQRTIRECYRALAFPNMESRVYDIDTATHGTCDWLFQNKTFCNWANKSHDLVWIKGKPGSGKSTLLKYVLGRSKDVPGASSSDIVLSFFFHRRGDNLQQSPEGLYRSLLHQLLREVPADLSEFISTFNKRSHEFGEYGIKWQWNTNELRDAFQSALPKVLETRSVWIYIDALDECGEDAAVELANGLKGVLQSLPASLSRFHLCFSCRHYPLLDNYWETSICTEYENASDVEAFVEEKLSRFVSEKKSHRYIQTKIVKRSLGVFMWARLVADQVLKLHRQGNDLVTIKNEIDKIPQELVDLYRKLIASMGPKSLKLIQWICFAIRPLEIDELHWAMAVEGGDTQHPLREYSGRHTLSIDAMERQVQTLSCGLAEVVASDKRGVVQFVHQSVADYFLGGGLLDLDPNSTTMKIAKGSAHSQFSQICIQYLTMEEIQKATENRGITEFQTSYPPKIRALGKDRMSRWMRLLSRATDPGFEMLTADIFDLDTFMRFPLLRYAIAAWPAHAKAADKMGTSQEYLFKYFGGPANALVASWVYLYEKFGGDRLGEGAELIHVLASWGLTGVLQEMQQSGTLADVVNLRDCRGRTPLLHAVKKRHVNVVQLLLSTGNVDPASRSKGGNTPLSLAVSKGDVDVVQALLNTGKANVESRDICGYTPLLIAVTNGHADIVQLLITHGGADVESRDDAGYTPLLHAAKNGKLDIVQLLVDAGKADLDARTKNKETALLLSAEEGQAEIAQFLINTGRADINSRDVVGYTPLTVAAALGHRGIVKLLIGTGKVDIDSRDDKGQTPLSWAAAKGELRVVRQLLNTGQADPYSRNYKGETPLLRAASEGWYNVMWTLKDFATGDDHLYLGDMPLSDDVDFESSDFESSDSEFSDTDSDESI